MLLNFFQSHWRRSELRKRLPTGSWAPGQSDRLLAEGMSRYEDRQREKIKTFNFHSCFRVLFIKLGMLFDCRRCCWNPFKRKSCLNLCHYCWRRKQPIWLSKGLCKHNHSLTRLFWKTKMFQIILGIKNFDKKITFLKDNSLHN